MKTCNLFISHSWSYSDQYEGLESLLRKAPRFAFKNYSVPKDDPIHTKGTDKELYNAIKQQVELSSVVLVLAGVYSTYSKWIEKEIKIAKNEFTTPKPIIAVEYWGSERTSNFVQENANRIVKWNADSIVGAIRRLA